MKRFIPAIFAILGILDLIYGIIRSDMLSLLIGPLMLGISVFIIWKERGVQ
jgi:hypothetical protein